MPQRSLSGSASSSSPSSENYPQPDRTCTYLCGILIVTRFSMIVLRKYTAEQVRELEHKLEIIKMQQSACFGIIYPLLKVFKYNLVFILVKFEKKDNQKVLFKQENLLFRCALNWNYVHKTGRLKDGGSDDSC